MCRVDIRLHFAAVPRESSKWTKICDIAKLGVHEFGGRSVGSIATQAMWIYRRDDGDAPLLETRHGKSGDQFSKCSGFGLSNSVPFDEVRH